MPGERPEPLRELAAGGEGRVLPPGDDRAFEVSQAIGSGAAPLDDEVSGINLAQAAGPVSGSVRPAVTAPPVSSRESERRRTASDPVAGSGAPGTTRWFVPAVFNWNGSLGLQASYLQTDTASLTQLAPVARLSGYASSYIWQPWLAQVTGNLGVALSGNQISGGDVASSVTSNSINGGARISLVPYSRFPAEAYFYANDTLNSGDVLTDRYRTNQVGARQNYRTPDQSGSYAAAYDRTVTQPSVGLRSVSDQLQFTASQPFVMFGRPNSFNASLMMIGREQPPFVSQTNYSATALHQVQPTDEIQVYDDFYYTRVDFEGNSFATYGLGNTTSWQPFDQPLTASLITRLNGFQQSQGNSDSSGQVLSTAAVASYAPTPNWNVFGNASVSDDTSIGLTTAQALGASYQANPLPLGRFTYNYGAGALGQNVTGPSSSTLLALNLNHALGSPGDTFAGGVLGYSIGQTASIGSATGDSFFRSQLSTTGSVSWTRASGFDSTSLNFTASDFRYLEGDGGGDSATLLATFNRVLTSRAALFGNASLQWNRADQASTTLLVNAQVGYRDSAWFGVPRLLFDSNLSITGQTEGTGGTRNTLDPSSYLYTWNNNVDYRIGRLWVQGRLQFARFGSANQMLALIQVTREFGN